MCIKRINSLEKRTIEQILISAKDESRLSTIQNHSNVVFNNFKVFLLIML